MKRPHLILFSRAVHILSGAFNLAFVYTPLHRWSFGFPVVQYITMPLLLITGYFLMHRRRQAHRLHQQKQFAAQISAQKVEKTANYQHRMQDKVINIA
jgi:hypothetical protein